MLSTQAAASSFVSLCSVLDLFENKVNLVVESSRLGVTFEFVAGDDEDKIMKESLSVGIHLDLSPL